VLILALDTTTRAGSVAVLRGARILVEHEGDPATTHAQRLPTDLMTACGAAGVTVADLDLLAVAAGPGSFTGLRVGIATVQGLAMARGLMIVPVSTLEAIAVAAPGTASRIVAWMDARRGEIFAQVFERTGDHHVRPLVEAMSGTPAAVLAAHASLIGGAAFHGDGALRYGEEIRRARAGSPFADRVPPLAAAVGLVAAAHPERAVPPHALSPIYVRRPDVELARERRAGDR
jgi:tRNA threonylcarbamoyladenosine biosynthesis protein TsaB